MVGGQTTYKTSIGAIECGAQEPLNLIRARCSLVGGNSQSIIPAQLPYYAIASLLSFILFLPALVSYYVVSAIFVFAAIFWGCKFFGLGIKNKYLKLLSMFIFLLSPFILGLGDFGGTYWAFILIPATLFFAWLILNSYKNKTTLVKRNTLNLLILWTLWASFLIFMDGYAFVMCAVAVLILHITLFDKKRHDIINLFSRVFLFMLGLVVSTLLYEVLIPAGSFGKSSITLFRAMGLDVVTVIIPVKNTILSSVTNIGTNWSHLWGDGSNTNNYIGVIMITLFIGGVIFTIKNKKLKIFNIYAAMLLIFLVGLGLSLGPSLKINSQINQSNSNLNQRYLMPSGSGVLDLPTTVVYRYAPGFSSTRATYRWFVLSEEVLIFFAVYCIEQIYSKKKRILAMLIIAFLLLDVLPSPSKALSLHENRGQENHLFDVEVIDDLKGKIKSDEVVLFYPNTAGGNDFLVNYISPVVGFKTYNIAGDKAVNAARKDWPNEIRQLLTGDLAKNQDVQLTRVILEKKYASVLIVPKFDLRWDSYSWPPKTKYHDTEDFEKRLNLHDMSVQKYKYFDIIRLKN